MASSSAMTTRVLNVVPFGLRPGLGREPVEQLVLRLLESADLVEDLGTVPLHRIGVALGVLVLPLGQRRLRHQRAEPGVVRGLGQVGELLVRHRQLVAELLEARADLGEATLDEGPGHARQCMPDRRPLPVCDDARMTRPSRRRPAMALVLAGSILAGCGGGGAEGACSAITREALDPSYLVHVLGDEAGVEYLSDPPTSGPHQPGPPVEGVVDDPLPPAVQVGILERGDVLVQHDPGLDDTDRRQLEGLAGEHVVVAPSPDLDDPVVATAWVFKRTCGSVDRDALQEFIEERVGHGPEE
jgi:hypothetical protein